MVALEQSPLRLFWAKAALVVSRTPGEVGPDLLRQGVPGLLRVLAPHILKGSELGIVGGAVRVLRHLAPVAEVRVLVRAHGDRSARVLREEPPRVGGVPLEIT